MSIDDTATGPDPLAARLATAFTAEGLDETAASTAVTAAMPLIREHLEAGETCHMTHTPPMDFAQCETHDETFPLGAKCRFEGRQLWEVFADEADEQRQRAVLLELAVEDAALTLADLLDDLPADDPTRSRLDDLRRILAGDPTPAAAGSGEPTGP